MSWCNTSSGGPSPARESCIVTPPIGMVSVVQLPVDVLTVAKAPPSRGLEPPRDACSDYPLRAWAGNHALLRGWRVGSQVGVERPAAAFGGSGVRAWSAAPARVAPRDGSASPTGSSA